MGKEVESSSSSSSSIIPVVGTAAEFTWRVWRKRYSLTSGRIIAEYAQHIAIDYGNFAGINDLWSSRHAMDSEVVPG